MKKTGLLLITIAILLAGNHAFSASGKKDQFESTLKLFKESSAVQKFINNSYGYAVFPTIGKGGWIVGGSYGKGQVYQNGILTGKVSVVEGSIGFQLGGKAFSEIIFFEDKRAYDEFTSGGFEFDATAQAIAITAGAEVKTGTTGNSAGASAGPKTGVQAETQYHKGMVTFVHSKGGLMYEVSISGQKFKFKPLLNHKK